MIDGILKDKSESVICKPLMSSQCARSLWKSLNLKAQCRRTGWFLKWMRREHTWSSTKWLLYETLAFFTTFWRWDAHWPSSHTALTFVDSHTLLSSSFFLSFKILVHDNIFHLTGTRGRFTPGLQYGFPASVRTGTGFFWAWWVCWKISMASHIESKFNWNCGRFFYRWRFWCSSFTWSFSNSHSRLECYAGKTKDQVPSIRTGMFIIYFLLGS